MTWRVTPQTERGVKKRDCAKRPILGLTTQTQLPNYCEAKTGEELHIEQVLVGMHHGKGVR